MTRQSTLQGHCAPYHSPYFPRGRKNPVESGKQELMQNPHCLDSALAPSEPLGADLRHNYSFDESHFIGPWSSHFMFIL